MSPQSRRTHPCQPTSWKRMSGYLVSGLGTAVCATSGTEAGIVPIDLASASLTGLNAGVTAGHYVNRYLPGPNGTYRLTVWNRYSGGSGLQQNYLPTATQIYFGVSALANGSTKKFGAGDSIGSGSALWPAVNNTASYFSLFKFNGSSAPNFGANNYIGFRMNPNTQTTTTYYYGYIEATWDTTTGNFQLLSAAYESTPNTAITTPSVVPEPSTLTLTGIGALAMGAGAIRRSRRARKESQVAAA